jgi:hypothetical protein
MKSGTAQSIWESVDHTPQNSIFNSFYYVKHESRSAMRKPVYETIWNNILRPVQTQVKHAAWYAIQDFMDENFPSPIGATSFPLYPATGPG